MEFNSLPLASLSYDTYYDDLDLGLWLAETITALLKLISPFLETLLGVVFADF